VTDDEKWRLIHAYRTASLNGDVEPICCPDDNIEMYPVVKRGKPALKCFECQTVFKIGLDTFEQIRKALDERA